MLSADELEEFEKRNLLRALETCGMENVRLQGRIRSYGSSSVHCLLSHQGPRHTALVAGVLSDGIYDPDEASFRETLRDIW